MLAHCTRHVEATPILLNRSATLGTQLCVWSDEACSASSPSIIRYICTLETAHGRLFKVAPMLPRDSRVPGREVLDTLECHVSDIDPLICWHLMRGARPVIADETSHETHARAALLTRLTGWVAAPHEIGASVPEGLHRQQPVEALHQGRTSIC